MRRERDEGGERWRDGRFGLCHKCLIFDIYPNYNTLPCLLTETDKKTQCILRTTKCENGTQTSYFSNHFNQRNTAFWFENKVAQS